MSHLTTILGTVTGFLRALCGSSAGVPPSLHKQCTRARGALVGAQMPWLPGLTWLIAGLRGSSPTPTATRAPTCHRQNGTPVTPRMYAVELGRLNAGLASSFVQSWRDDATERFLADASFDRCNRTKLRRHHQDFLRFRSAQTQGLSRTDASAANLRVAPTLTLTLAVTPTPTLTPTITLTLGDPARRLHGAVPTRARASPGFCGAPAL